ncbi:MAG: hypothetical protein R3A13_05205 [Bdellovibrionota bacterium]
MGRPNIDFEAFNLMPVMNLTGSPERNLLMAIVERAILDLVGNDSAEEKRAEEWIFGDLDEHKPLGQFSFPWICEQLDLDIEQTAEKIRQMPKRGSRRVAPWYFAKAS